MSYEKKSYKKVTLQRRDNKTTYQSQRGKLCSLMTEEQKSVTDVSIHDLSFDFACRITRLYQYLTENSETKEYIISKQVFRSGTSIGANLNEGRHPQSDSDFLSKSSIALKEARETEYWLKLLHANGYLNESQYLSLDQDLTRILKILVTIVGKVSTRLKNEKKKN